MGIFVDQFRPRLPVMGRPIFAGDNTRPVLCAYEGGAIGNLANSMMNLWSKAGMPGRVCTTMFRKAAVTQVRQVSALVWDVGGILERGAGVDGARRRGFCLGLQNIVLPLQVRSSAPELAGPLSTHMTHAMETATRHYDCRTAEEAGQGSNQTSLWVVTELSRLRREEATDPQPSTSSAP